MEKDTQSLDNHSCGLDSQQNRQDGAGKNKEIPFLSDCGLVTTYHCQASCPHCIVEAGPKRKEFIPLAAAENWLEQISNYGNGQIKAVALTGGEPFSNLEYLAAISNKAGSLGLLVTAVTNAFWATSEKAAQEVLKQLPSVRLITFSTDNFHQRVIPVTHIRNAWTAAEALNRTCNIAVCTGSKIDRATQETLDFLAEFAPSDAINTARVFPVGRARSFSNRLEYCMSSSPPKEACSMAHAPVILPDGTMLACFGPIVSIKNSHPLRLGNLHEESLHEILTKAELNPVLHALRIWGPHKLISMIQKTDYRNFLPESYVTDSICCVCHDLMQNQNLMPFFDNLNRDRNFIETVAYGRIYYLHEERMAELALAKSN